MRTELLIGWLLLLPSIRLVAQTIELKSTFDRDLEGWTVSVGVAMYRALGGNPGGFIRTTDLFGWNAYHAPASFLGNQSAAYGGVLHLEQQVLSSDGANQPMVVISDGTTMLQFFTTPPGLTWTVYDIPLLASGGWEISNGTGGHGPAASEAQLQTVLANLLFLNLDADWQTGEDRVDLDNVKLCSASGCTSSVPEPASMGLLLIGVAASLIVRARRRI